MYAVEVSDQIMVAHSFRGAIFGPAQKLHGATFVIRVAFLAESLDSHGIVVDIGRAHGALKEVLLVIDASTGQNGLVQAKQFADAVDVTGIALTKLDGTAKGGIVLAYPAAAAQKLPAGDKLLRFEDLKDPALDALFALPAPDRLRFVELDTRDVRAHAEVLTETEREMRIRVAVDPK